MNSTIRKTAAVVCAALGMAATAAAAAPPDGFRMGRSMEILVNMMRDINLFYVDEVDTDELLYDAAAGMTSGLDPYTEYISEEDMAAFQVMTMGRYAGVGSLIRQSGDYVVFAEPYRNSPADRAGIVVGDKIVEIDGEDARGMTTAQISERLRGEAGTKVRLKIEKFYGGEVVPLEIRREVISIPGIPYYGMLNDSIGYILNIDFTEDVSSDMRTAVMSLREQGARALVLDYRNNGGGIVQEAVKILSFFVPRGTEVVSMRGRDLGDDVRFVTQSEPIAPDMPLAVLVNNASASAAEIVAGALQDLDRAVIVGRRSFGKGLVQTTRPMGYNSYLKITTAKYYLPSGRCIQAIDYARRAEDGTISHIPDSLIHEYRTAVGRKVYDGGGIMPDERVEAAYVSRFAYLVYGKGYVFDFVDRYLREHPDLQLDPATFALTDETYDEFVEFMADKDVEWESETKRTLEQLKACAEAERYDEAIASLLEAIEASLHDDVATGLQMYRQELTELIENEIVLRKAYSAGVTEHALQEDTDVHAAIRILEDPSLYEEILTRRDTDRK